MSISLEDTFTDIIAKAQRGWGVSDSQLAEAAGLELALIREIKNGEVHFAALEKIALVLRLNANALTDLATGKYQPAVVIPAGLKTFNTPYSDFTVNSYLVWDAETRDALVFDTGSDASELLQTIAEENLIVRAILLTHTHGDHVFDLDRVVEKTSAPVFCPPPETMDGTTAFNEGETFSAGRLQVRALLTNGHSPGGTSFLVAGLSTPIAVVGDSLFAASMGGAAQPMWTTALHNNREKILTLPVETILCPGHGPLTTVGLESAHNPFFRNGMIEHLYVHIPFCPKVCPYCSFYKEAFDRHKTQRFLDALLLELDAASGHFDLRPRTIFFGGGTPTALSTPQLTFLLEGLRARLDLSNLREWTMEMNPATVSLEKAERLRDLGINRVSMGVQAWDEATLQKLGRVHSSAQAARSYQILREAGFTNINLDLIFGTPGQTAPDWFAGLQRTIDLAPNHISAYCLTYEEDTEFFRRFQSGDLQQDEDADADLYEGTIQMLETAGFAQYETSNFARDDVECDHNLAYWLGSNYLGLGPSAFSTVNADRWKNIPDTTAYCDLIEGGGQARSFYEEVTSEVRKSEQIAFGLRTSRGVPIAALTDQTARIDRLTSDGFLTQSGERIFLTGSGRLVADSVAELLI